MRIAVLDSPTGSKALDESVMDVKGSRIRHHKKEAKKTGVGKCPMTWEYWTSPYSSHYRPYT